jgi:disulfide oxidoreductase YuzD
MSGINGIICVRCNHFKDTKEFVSPLYKNKYVKRCASCRDIINAKAKTSSLQKKLTLGDYKFTLHNGNIIPL